MAELSSTSSPDAPSSGTSPSLLVRIGAGEPAAWDRFVRVYAPLVFHWCRRARLQDHDVEDVFQEVFQAVLTHIGGFKKARPGGTLRGWLFTITRNKVRDHCRRAGREPRGEGGTEAFVRFSQIAAPERKEACLATDGAPGAAADPDDACEDGDRRALIRRALERIRIEFREQTWNAFWRTAVDGQAAADVATDLGMSSGAVRVARSRVLRRLREEIGDLDCGEASCTS